jgi:hypothetical protein
MNSYQIVFILDKPVFFRLIRPVVTLLDSLGHDVKVGFLKSDATSERDLFEEYLARTKKEQLELPFIATSKVATLARQLIDVSVFSDPCHPSPDLYSRVMPGALRFAGPIVRRLLKSDTLLRALRSLRKKEPKNSELSLWLQSTKADAIVFCPYIFQHLGQSEFVSHAARTGTATIAQVASWDNLTTKRTFHKIPDRVLVWNEKLKREAIEIHGVPQERLRVVGAPVFDFWFETGPNKSKAQWNGKIGLPEGGSYVLYLCSSKNICKDESASIDALITAYRSLDKNTFFVIRPHPTNHGVCLRTKENIVIYPPKGAANSSQDSLHDFRLSVKYASAVVGVNTSAIIEAAILQKTCVLLHGEIAGDSAAQFGHVQHLMSLGSVCLAEDFTDAAKAIRFALHKEKTACDTWFENVVKFVRPNGIDTSASQVVVDAIFEAIAEKYAVG